MKMIKIVLWFVLWMKFLFWSFEDFYGSLYELLELVYFHSRLWLSFVLLLSQNPEDSPSTDRRILTSIKTWWNQQDPKTRRNLNISTFDHSHSFSEVSLFKAHKTMSESYFTSTTYFWCISIRKKCPKKKKISYFMMEWIVEKVSFGRICSYRDLWHSLRDRWSYLRGFEGLRGLHIVMRVFVMFSQIIWLRFWRLWWCSAEQRPGFPAPPAQRHHVKSINKTRGNKAAGKWSLCGHPLPSMRHVWPLHPFIIDVARITGTAHTVKYSPAAPLLEKKGKKMGECHKTNCITL